MFAIIASCFMISAFSAGAQTTINFTYDADGYVVAKTVNGVTTQYLVDNMNPTGLPQVVEESVNVVVQRRYAYGKQRISETQLINGSWTTSYYSYDAQGNVRQLTNAAGVVTDTYDYDAFGNLINHTGSTPNVYLYRGERFDPDMGMYCMRARWYNPATGRFMSRDPEEGEPDDPASLHKYLYANGDPVNLADPTGRMTAEYPVNLSGIAVSPAVISGLGATALAIECAYLWNATRSEAEVQAGLTQGTVRMVAPCVWKASCKPRTVDDVKSQCTPVGPIISEPATGNDYKGCTSYEQEYACECGPYTIHWIMCPGYPDPASRREGLRHDKYA
ncbi:MAG: RHS repeat-associated core domain-containing protein [Terracidiphilus sp.]|jgi:RHS repeat-associated protein